MGSNRIAIVLVLVIVAGLVGWGLYLRQYNETRALLEEVPDAPLETGDESSTDNTSLVAFQQFADNTLTGSVRTGPGGQTLETRTYPVSESVSVIAYNPYTNDYVAIDISELNPGTWIVIETDDSGAITAITAGQ